MEESTKTHMQKIRVSALRNCEPEIHGIAGSTGRVVTRTLTLDGSTNLKKKNRPLIVKLRCKQKYFQLLEKKNFQKLFMYYHI